MARRCPGFRPLPGAWRASGGALIRESGKRETPVHFRQADVAARVSAPGLSMPPPSTFVPSVKRAEPAPRSAATPQTGPRGSRFTLAPLALFCVLTIQAVLSLRLVWSNTAFLDEATYLFVGHVELAHWRTGSSVPAYPTYLSGAPVIYPPLVALAGDLGGLAAARILSMCFMLGATSFLWGMTSRLAGRRAAFFAAAIFAALGPTQYLGAFSTYDAMALFLMSAAAWCVVAARSRPDSTPLLLAGAALLALANATKYATGIFDPVIIALAALGVAAKRGIKPGVGRAGFVAVCSVGLLAVLLGVGGPLYVTGVLSTTLARASGGNSPLIVLQDATNWVGVVVLLAGLAVIVALLARQERIQVAVFALLAAAGLLVPLNQARIHTTTSLSKHVDFGAWFAAAAAGYALARLSRVGRWKGLQAVTVPLAVGAVLAVGIAGRAQAGDFFQVWPNSTDVIANLQPLIRSHPGNYLAEDYDVPAYYLEGSIPWNRWFDTWYFSYTRPGTKHPLTGPAAYRAAIDDHYFALIILDFGDTAGVDKLITEDIRKSGDYHVIAEARYWDKFGTGQFTIWAYQPPRHDRKGHRGNS